MFGGRERLDCRRIDRSFVPKALDAADQGREVQYAGNITQLGG